MLDRWAACLEESFLKVTEYADNRNLWQAKTPALLNAGMNLKFNVPRGDERPFTPTQIHSLIQQRQMQLGLAHQDVQPMIRLWLIPPSSLPSLLQGVDVSVMQFLPRTAHHRERCPIVGMG